MHSLGQLPTDRSGRDATQVLGWALLTLPPVKPTLALMRQARCPALGKDGRSGHHRSTLWGPLIHRILENADDFFRDGDVVARHAVHRSHSGHHRGSDP